MPEDAGKKKFVRNFLEHVGKGEGLVEWIERTISPPGTGQETSTARSSSGRSISTMTKLLEDDLSYSFDEGYFTFRFVSAEAGSGKTTLVTYLHDLIEANPEYMNRSVVVRFPLFQLLAIPGNQAFNIKL